MQLIVWVGEGGTDSRDFCMAMLSYCQVNRFVLVLVCMCVLTFSCQSSKREAGRKYTHIGTLFLMGGIGHTLRRGGGGTGTNVVQGKLNEKNMICYF